MSDLILVYSKFAKQKFTGISYDIVSYQNALYGGLNLFKNFRNYLLNNTLYPVVKFDNYLDAEKYFENYTF